MALNIKRQETERKVRMLAQRTNLSVTDAIERAADRWSAELDRESGAAAEYEKMKAWFDSLPPTPSGVTSTQLLDELYNKDGSFAP